ncbi:unnamed protein product [Ceutorhynchus assimilis]|uniref:MADF domain-containing protein n=1 Tax=Ceutorhynchus assimilis TaxID=467358 RepID=A0A9N9MPV9_9CUCU|nr:unnamed protein product [Ceutorhynchus assimilis]
MGRLMETYVDAQLKFDSKLVNIVKEHKHLFDRTHKLFEDGGTRRETWEVIAQQLQKTDSYCEKRWVYIINRLYDEIFWMLKYESPSPWLLYPQLDFLCEYIDWEDVNGLCNELMEFDLATALEGV